MRRAIALLLLVFLAGIAAYVWNHYRIRRPAPPDPRFRTIAAPPGNEPRTVRPAPTTAPPMAGLPQGNLPAIVVLRGGRTVQGEVDLTGTLDVTPASLVLTPPTGDPLEIRWRLPADLPVPPPFTGPGTVVATLHPHPHRARRVVVRGPDDLLFAFEEWAAPDPIAWDFVPGSRIVQEAVPPPPNPGAVPVPAILMNGSAPTPLPVGRLVRAPLRTGPHAFFTQASARELVSTKESGSGDRYVIRVWVTNG